MQAFGTTEALIEDGSTAMNLNTDIVSGKIDEHLMWRLEILYKRSTPDHQILLG